MIVKIQRSLAGPDRVLIYNKTRRTQHEFEAADVPGVIKALAGDSKGFFRVTFNGGAFTIDAKLGDQGW